MTIDIVAIHIAVAVVIETVGTVFRCEGVHRVGFIDLGVGNIGMKQEAKKKKNAHGYNRKDGGRKIVAIKKPSGEGIGSYLKASLTASNDCIVADFGYKYSQFYFPSTSSKNASKSKLKSLGFSIMGAWPHLSSMCRREFSMRSLNFSPTNGGVTMS